MHTNKSHIIKHITKRVSLLPLYLCELLPNQKIVVHELGHCLKLHHPFGTENKIPDEDFQRQSTGNGNTENIMDYDKTRMHTFWLWQWIIINNNIKYYNR
jgi:hypothetical protein